jgi:hypothetical protein|tara:strand:- start:587 stop:1330 length:744 start_codon:yes stop_codon:yes gene_type:complete
LIIPFFKLVLIIYASILTANTNPGYIQSLVFKTEQQYQSVTDFQVEMEIKLDVPGFRMPKKKFKVFFKQPNKVKIKTTGFGVLPKTGLFTSPVDNFDNLKELTLITVNDKNKPNDIIISGQLITDSLKVKIPNEYARLTFIPTVDVKLDTLRWVIKSVTTRIDTLKIMKINNNYDIVDGDYYLPVTSTVEYYIKDAKLSKWLKKDISTVIGKDQDLKSQKNDLVEGNIKIKYNKYKVNRGISDKIFK